MVLVKDKNNKFIIQSLNFRSRYVDELNKLQGLDSIDLAKPTSDMQDVAIYRCMQRVTEKERDEYLEHLKEHYDVKVYDDPYLWAYSYVQSADNSVITLPRQKGNEKLMRGFWVDNDKKFPPLDKNGKPRGKYNLISYRDKGSTDENELDTYVQTMSNLKLKKRKRYHKKESNTQKGDGEVAFDKKQPAEEFVTDNIPNPL